MGRLEVLEGPAHRASPARWLTTLGTDPGGRPCGWLPLGWALGMGLLCTNMKGESVGLLSFSRIPRR